MYVSDPVPSDIWSLTCSLRYFWEGIKENIDWKLNLFDIHKNIRKQKESNYNEEKRHWCRKGNIGLYERDWDFCLNWVHWVIERDVDFLYHIWEQINTLGCCAMGL